MYLCNNAFDAVCTYLGTCVVSDKVKVVRLVGTRVVVIYNLGDFNARLTTNPISYTTGALQGCKCMNVCV